jgi:hypothetical protein
VQHALLLKEAYSATAVTKMTHGFNALRLYYRQLANTSQGFIGFITAGGLLRYSRD